VAIYTTLGATVLRGDWRPTLTGETIIGDIYVIHPCIHNFLLSGNQNNVKKSQCEDPVLFEWTQHP
jgi:hypothetical protein